MSHPVRVQRNPTQEDIDQNIVWCEWLAGGYHLRALALNELTPLPQAQWPAWPGE